MCRTSTRTTCSTATTLAILAGFAHNRRVMIQGYHGTGKSTHIEQVAARLNWPCVRVNLDSHISRIDLIGKDAIVIRDGLQVTEFRDGILPWALQHNVALCFDEYDAGRPDVMFVIQRVLEVAGKLTLLDQNKVIRPHPSFRLFATANTVGLGDTSGLYHGTQQINQGQMDRWSIVATLNYLPHDKEVEIVLAKAKHYRTDAGPRHRQQDGAGRRPDPQRLHERRPLDGDEPAHGDHLGGERRHLRRHRLRVPADLPEQVRRARAADGGGVLPALLRQGTAGKRGERRAELEVVMPGGPGSPLRGREWGRPAPLRAVTCKVSSNRMPKPSEGRADRAVEVLHCRLHARDRQEARARRCLRGGAAALTDGEGAAAGTAAAAHRADIAIVRGHADSMALRLACHDRRSSQARADGQPARAVFDAVEQARVEAIGARRMQGIADNLSAMLDDRFHRGNYDEITDRADAPLEDAVAMMVRERLTGLAPPPAAQKIVDLWRAYRGWRRPRSRSPERLIDNQRASAMPCTIFSSASTWTMTRRRLDEEEERGGRAGPPQGRAGEEGEGAEAEDTQTPAIDEADVSGDDMADATAGRRRASAELADDAEMGDAETRPSRGVRAGPANEPRGPDYKAFITKFDEVVAAEDLCEPKS